MRVSLKGWDPDSFLGKMDTVSHLTVSSKGQWRDRQKDRAGPARHRETPRGEGQDI